MTIPPPSVLASEAYHPRLVPSVEQLHISFFFSSRRRHTRWNCDWSSDVCSSDLVSGRTVQLTPTEYDLLKALVQAAGRVLTHRQLLQQVWGANYATESHLLRVNISNLRRKLEAGPDRPTYILTEPRVGFRLWVGEVDTQAE